MKATKAALIPAHAPGVNTVWLLDGIGALVADGPAMEVVRIADALVVVVKRVVSSSVSSLAGTKSVPGHPVALLHAFDKQHPRKGGDV